MNVVDLNTLASPLTLEDAQAIAAADSVRADLADARVLYALGIAHAMGKRAIVTGGALPYDDASAPAGEAVLPFAALFAHAAVLKGVVDAAAIEPPVRDYLAAHGILSARDLERLDLDALAAAPSIGRTALRRFVRELAKSERYPDAEKLKEFLVRRGIFV
ncbi:MAG TPA: hypothetical protein VFN10_21875 [Thermoanaerobaculia bacterium]|nr:hypothetical protein [Thermoanaerobaculia bacterium]